LKALKLLPARWRFASENYRAVIDATSVYDAPRWLPAALFAGVILWQLAAAVLFARAAVLCCIEGNIARAAASAAFTAGAGLPAVFMLADEIFLQYERQASHATLFIAQLATWMAVLLLPG
ncbi:MAG TPA: hypothetical protein VGH50_14130, partial [Candidatus Binatia bacterium]